jgi:hypothetical protein
MSGQFLVKATILIGWCFTKMKNYAECGDGKNTWCSYLFLDFQNSVFEIVITIPANVYYIEWCLYKTILLYSLLLTEGAIVGSRLSLLNKINNTS